MARSQYIYMTGVQITDGPIYKFHAYSYHTVKREAKLAAERLADNWASPYDIIELRFARDGEVHGTSAELGYLDTYCKANGWTKG